MSKKQTIRTLGSIERIQPTQTKKNTQKPKKLNKELDLELDENIESDNNIENYSDDNDDVILETKKNKSKNPDVKKKRVISDDQKKY